MLLDKHINVCLFSTFPKNNKKLTWISSIKDFFFEGESVTFGSPVDARGDTLDAWNGGWVGFKDEVLGGEGGEEEGRDTDDGRVGLG